MFIVTAHICSRDYEDTPQPSPR